jgi:hypothetical protein
METLARLVTHDNWASARLWTLEFDAGSNFLTALMERSGNVEFAILLYTADDLLLSRGNTYHIARDNVIFEYGLFVSKLGPLHSILVAPKEHDLKFMSDIAGYSVVTYEKEGLPEEYLMAAALKIRKDFSALWNDRPRADPKDQRLSQDLSLILPEHIVAPILVPIYRNLTDAEDWYRQFEISVAANIRSLDQRMLYYGPGLAKNWINATVDMGSFTSMDSAFAEIKTTLLRCVSANQVTVVDLGVGSCRWGATMLSQFIHDRSAPPNYVAMDISHEMLVFALNLDPDRGMPAVTLREVLNRGARIIGIHGDFTRLPEFGSLFTNEGVTVFLLMGNTLGNELDEIDTLSCIKSVMKGQDLLIVEVQEIEEELRPASDVQKLLQENDTSVKFLAGPFLALGCAPNDVEIKVARDDEEAQSRGIEAVAYRISCAFRKKLVVRHPTFTHSEVNIKQGQISVLIVRKYSHRALRSIFDRAGLDVLDIISPKDMPKHKKFAYVMARNRAIEGSG